MPRTREEIEADLATLREKRSEFLRPDTSGIGGSYNFSSTLAQIQTAIDDCKRELLELDGPTDIDVYVIP